MKVHEDSFERELAVVVIGRNEGDRLRASLTSAMRETPKVLYVDSGSSDGSVSLARSLGAMVVELDLDIPFTAARARNTGLAHASTRWPEISFVQFVDADCELDPRWLSRCHRLMRERPEIAAAAGQLRERHPDMSVYNTLCDMSWKLPEGEILACGGNAMMRVAALRECGGYRDDLIAGEESELCVRMRARGWKIQGMAEDMALHDAAMTTFKQWWIRTVRTGFSYAQGAHIHGAAPERHCVSQTRSAIVWGGALPVLILATFASSSLLAALLSMAYPAQVLRLYLTTREGSRKRRFIWAFFTVLGKFPELLGVLRFRFIQAAGRRPRLLEYKHACRTANANGDEPAR
jgi:GT2 family glycosyltransferase